jgi:predicted dehydrogenase
MITLQTLTHEQGSLMETISRVLLVGCGGISRLWLEPLITLPNAEPVGLVDVVEANARARAEEFRLGVPVGTDLQAMLERTRPDIVFDCTIPEAHYEVTLMALAAGCHVFGEKPMADTLEQARELVQAAARAGRVFAVMQNRQFEPNIQAVRTFLDSGVIGEVTTVNADFFIAAHFGGFRDRMKHVLIKDMAIHTFDAARFLTRKEPLAVYCHEWNPKGSWYDQDASANAIFEMTNGVVFNYRGSWCSEGCHTSWESQWRIIGTKGTLTWDGATGLQCEVVKTPEGFMYEHESVPPPELVVTEMRSWHARAISAFIDSVQQGLEPQTVCTDNIHSLAMVFGAVASAEARQRVEIRV